MTVEEKDKGGRPPHVPDDKTRKTVEAMSSYGIPQEDIAKVIGLDPKTLRKHYEYELDTAEIKANAQVAQRLYQKCMNDDTSSIIFWLKNTGAMERNHQAGKPAPRQRRESGGPATEHHKFNIVKDFYIRAGACY
jgi:hypothetical protein